MMPFPGGIDANPNATLLFSIAAAAIYVLALELPPRLARSAAKTLAVALLAALAVMQGSPPLLVAALALSAAGDAFLSQHGEKAFLAGLASFLAAHVAYVALFLNVGGGIGLLTAESWRGAIALALAVFVITMLAALWRRVGPALRVPVAVYAGAILAMGVSALTTFHPWVIAGAVLFIKSDGLLAAERFLLAASSPHRVWMRYAVWVLYYAAQLAITLGFLLA